MGGGGDKDPLADISVVSAHRNYSCAKGEQKTESLISITVQQKYMFMPVTLKSAQLGTTFISQVIDKTSTCLQPLIRSNQFQRFREKKLRKMALSGVNMDVFPNMQDSFLP